MKRITHLLIAIVMLSSLCISSTAYAGLFSTKEEKETSIKKVKEVDLPVLRDRAKFFKQKLEELKAKNETQIQARSEICRSIDNIAEQMNDIALSTGLPTRINRLGIDGQLPLARFKLSNLEMKLDEMITIINSIIGPEKAK